MKGIVKGAKFAYQKTVKVYPVKHDYGEGYYKWSCPVCDHLGNNHQLTKDIKNCPLCNVNLSWDKEEIDNENSSNYNQYMVSWQDNEGADYIKVFKIEQTVNRPNNPDDETIIASYMKVYYGDSIRNHSICIDDIDEIVTIGEDYFVEI